LGKRSHAPLRTEGKLVDVARGESAEKELDAMIERRSLQKDPDEESEPWQELVRRFDARRREANRIAWGQYFGRIAAGLRSRAEEYDHRAQALLEDRGRGLVRCAAPR
jgi:hypothetical protein